MVRRTGLRFALLSVASLFIAAWYGFAGDEKAEPGPRAANAKARRDAARTVYEASWKHHVQAPDDRGADVVYFHDWSVRWLQAERDLGREKADQISALEGHLKRMQFWKEMLSQQVKERQAPAYEATAGEFFVLEAEDWLAAAKEAGK